VRHCVRSGVCDTTGSSVSVVSTPVPLVDDPEGPVSMALNPLPPISSRLTCRSFSSCRQEEVNNQPTSSPFFGRRRAFPGDPLWSVFSCFIHNVPLQPPFFDILIIPMRDDHFSGLFSPCKCGYERQDSGGARVIGMRAMVDMKKTNPISRGDMVCSAFDTAMASVSGLHPLLSETSVVSIVIQQVWGRLVMCSCLSDD
jgi:hypothetical protein